MFVKYVHSVTVHSVTFTGNRVDLSVTEWTYLIEYNNYYVDWLNISLTVINFFIM